MRQDFTGEICELINAGAHGAIEWDENADGTTTVRAGGREARVRIVTRDGQPEAEPA